MTCSFPEIATGPFTVSTPLTLPVLLLLIPSLVSLYAAVDLRLSWSAVCMLIAGMALCLSLPQTLNSEPHLSKAFGFFLIAGVVVAAGPFLSMQLPGSKVPLISGLYSYLPTWLPRTIHPNYLGGTLTFFFPTCDLRAQLFDYSSEWRKVWNQGTEPLRPFLIMQPS